MLRSGAGIFFLFSLILLLESARPAQAAKLVLRSKKGKATGAPKVQQVTLPGPCASDKVVPGPRQIDAPFHSEFATTYPSCFDACSACEAESFVDGKMTCSCEVHCWKGNDPQWCDKYAGAGWTDQSASEPLETWSSSCSNSIFEKLPAPVRPCKQVCTSFPMEE